MPTSNSKATESTFNTMQSHQLHSNLLLGSGVLTQLTLQGQFLWHVPVYKLMGPVSGLASESSADSVVHAGPESMGASWGSCALCNCGMVNVPSHPWTSSHCCSESATAEPRSTALTSTIYSQAHLFVQLKLLYMQNLSFMASQSSESVKAKGLSYDLHKASAIHAS